MLDAALEAVLVRRFADAVMTTAELPVARRADVEAAPTFTALEGKIRCVCGITGSTYDAPWDGKGHSAEAFATQAGQHTADLVTGSRHYAWLRATR